MKQLRKIENGRLVTVYYSSPEVKDVKTAVRFITRTAALEGFQADIIALRDTLNTSDEMNASREFPADTAAETILAACRKHCFQRIFLSGKWETARLGVGVDLANFEIAVTGSARRLSRIASLAGRL